jgi:hypothetical protein
MTTTITKGQIGEQDFNKYDGSGTNTFSRTTSAGDTLTLNKVGYEVDALDVYGAGVTYTDATITSALTAIGNTTKCTIVLKPGTWTISANKDWSSYTNVTFKIPRGVVISHSSYNVALPYVDAGDYYFFSGTGTATVLNKTVLIDWWCSDTTGATDMSWGLQQAISSGDVVDLNSHTILASDVTVDASTTFKNGTLKSQLGTSSNSKTYSRNILTATSVSKLKFFDMTFNGGITNQASSDTSVNHDELEVMLKIDTCSDITLERVLFDKYTAMANSDSPTDPTEKQYRGCCTIKDSTDIKIKDVCIGDGNRIEGLAIIASASSSTSNIHIDHLYTTQTGAYRISSPLIIYGEEVRDVVIENCRFQGHAGSGMNIFSPINMIIRNNTFKNGRGIDLSNEASLVGPQTPSHVVIENNWIDLSTADEATPLNPASKSSFYGIYVNGIDSSTFIDDLVIKNNYVANAKYPITVWYGTSVSMEGNTVRDCYKSSVGGSSLYIRNVYGCDITKNKVYMPGTGSGGNGEINLLIKDSDDVLVDGNLFDGAKDAHVYINKISTASDNVTISNNTFKDTTQAPTYNISVDGTSEVAKLKILNNNYPDALAGSAYNAKNNLPAEPITVVHTLNATVADDGFISIAVKPYKAFVQVTCDSGSESALVINDTSALTEVKVGTDVALTTGALDGTTGSDAKTTLSVDSGIFYLENRMGASRTYSIRITR